MLGPWFLHPISLVPVGRHPPCPEIQGVHRGKGVSYPRRLLHGSLEIESGPLQLSLLGPVRFSPALDPVSTHPFVRAMNY